jgi:hypothetical protein
VFVRSARIEDVEAIALIMAALAEEGLIATEPPVDLELPILGICRGAQALNVARGGTLHQHLPMAGDGCAYRLF